ncbi:hypothetical protein QT970_14860 [Microcoleus sp. herbarium8]|jgi:hypothetical protein|uniref:hypothetical protein n=1 Tax=Microcoleus sp. herbarium8 TaxID=3055436 RepID=UPI002FCEA295
MTTTNSQIKALLPDGFSQEAQKKIIAMVLESYTESKDLGKQVEATIKQFEADYPALAVCPRCEGCGCNYCDFDGVYDPLEKEPDGTN